MHRPDDWLDVFRIFLFFVSTYSVLLLAIRYRNGGNEWNIKTKDYWFSALMWSLSGCVFTMQGIALDRPLTPATVFMTAAILTTGKAVHRKGDWGSNAK
jgi:hypothetical protein